ncbi:hypothetical protein L226DRAFT_613329 [Lentinus tigrinus ALCF2SS1-7]|uniref:Pkr1-domain-containing protein n=1 Tax=Lentinus tigrinus ALCF2SS1-6 TaxID=1328759 RepID=A0A5C2SE56_9APHY|nr:hypothetical protein L227DRAFT_652147 [Lentinus tigrinus ALCF2SS1-6]RPD74487.1 hypothetical protein L226DRAFT_613329 [Lentinus tigrinus ALCF2SS1-7]
MAESNLPAAGSPEVSQDGPPGDFLSNILTPGSSLNPVFLTIVDGVLATLLLIFLGLLILSRGSIHFIFLMFITGCLWASVKWFVAELQSMRTQEAGQNSPTTAGEKRNTKAKDE